MKCPVCGIMLNRCQYEGVFVRGCDQCRGLLITESRLHAIEQRRDESILELQTEATTANRDTKEKLRCSQCFASMVKVTKNLGDNSFLVDRCDKCKLLWFDAGEIAKWQLAYESSEQGLEAKRFRDRLRNMKPEEREAYEKRIAELPEGNPALDISLMLADWIHRRSH